MWPFFGIILVLAYLQKKVRLYFVLKRPKNPHKIMEGAEPYLSRKSKKVGVLLLHGFTSTPNEVKPLSEFLSKKHITVYAPLIAGHGTHVEDLARTRTSDWEKSTKDAYDKISRMVDNVYVIGSSFGGNLAFRIAKNKKKVAGLVTMGTPIFFRRDRTFKVVLALTSMFMNFVKKRYHIERDRELVKKKVHYKEFPLNCLGSMSRFMRHSVKDLPGIKVPALIMQSETDALLNEQNAYSIYNKLGSKDKKIFFVPDSYHVFCLDKNKGKAFREIFKFIKETSQKNGIQLRA